jgi:hypothetical protein
MVALDGTPMSDRIVDAVAAFPFLSDTHVTVVSVAPSSVPGPGVMLSGVYGMPVAVRGGRRRGAALLEQVAATAAQRLRREWA